MKLTDAQQIQFWSKVDKSQECWIWLADRNTSHGHGRIKLKTGPGQYRKFLAHRISWELAHGPIPEGLIILHKCDNPPCVNPDHLFLGTLRDNALDMHAKGRHRIYQSKLNLKTARLIRILRRGGASYADLCAQFNVSKSTIGSVLAGKSWPEPH